ncbi:hypothetical protein HY501_01000 [Candidatus Woesearchaeota archaeon]|nr:hypothetical protein [Candidatus Woesearchaeota archaeon]
MRKELELVKEGPYGCIIEKKPITVAAIKAEKRYPGTYSTRSTHPLLESVVFDPRYIPPGFQDFKLIQVRGRRLGRTIDILLDEPIQVDETGKEYPILTFKGCGARIVGVSAEGPWIIDPYNWHSDRANQLDRIWGALPEQGAKIEAQKEVRFMEEFGLKVTPYVGANTIPKQVLAQIFEKGEQKSLGQALRLCETNVLLSDLFSEYTQKYPFGQPGPLSGTRAAAKIKPDSKFLLSPNLIEVIEKNTLSYLHSLIEVCRFLYQQGKALKWTVRSDIIDNMYTSGEMKDLENICIGQHDSEIDHIFQQVYPDIMNTLSDAVLRVETDARVFLSIDDARQYIFSSGKKAASYKKPKIKMPDDPLFISSGKFNGVGENALSIAGFAGKDGLTWDPMESYSGIGLEDAIALDLELKEKGFRLMRRKDLGVCKLLQAKEDYLRHALAQRLNGSYAHLLSTIQVEKERSILYDDLTFSSKGEIDFSKAKKSIVQHSAGYWGICGWDPALAWPIAGIRDAQLYPNQYWVEKGPGMFPITVGFNQNDRPPSLIITARPLKEGNLLPLVVYEYIHEG